MGSSYSLNGYNSTLQGINKSTDKLLKIEENKTAINPSIINYFDEIIRIAYTENEKQVKKFKKIYF
jgi:hypothetical protein